MPSVYWLGNKCKQRCRCVETILVGSVSCHKAADDVSHESLLCVQHKVSRNNLLFFDRLDQLLHVILLTDVGGIKDSFTTQL